MNLHKIRKEFHRIAAVQGWSQLHTPNNLAQALAVEVGELLQAMQNIQKSTLQRKNDSDRLASIAGEIADVQMYLLVLAESLGVDLEEAIEQKQAYNRDRFDREDT